MDTFLHNKFVNNLHNKFNLQHKPSILVAISGGQDSLCLIKLLLDIQKNIFSDIGIIHIDHQWRNDTVTNTKHLVNLVSTVKYSSYFYQIQSNKYSEHDARELRYQILINTAYKYKYSFILTAHSNHDRIETFLQNLFKGSISDNISSLIWNRTLTNKKQLIKPLINIKRAEITWFCRYYYLPLWSDKTNIVYSKTRNRIRQELIPYIKLYFQPNFEIQLNKFLDYIALDSDYLKQNAIKLYLQIKHPTVMAIYYQELLQQHKSIQERTMKLFLEYNTHIHCERTILSTIINFAQCRSSHCIKYGPFRIKINNKWIYICNY